jgi:hypothetical protein
MLYLNVRHAFQEVLGEVLAVADPDKSTTAFAKALDLRRKAYSEGTGSKPTSMLLNNAGVLQYRSKEFSKSLELMLEALEQQQGLFSFLIHDSAAACRIEIRARVHRIPGFSSAMLIS